ncbi:DNA mismatch repair endonuclease MutL [Geothrix sp. PMB-07]|uniref:DNA mismatch repair endonuclease MutL n=1 Tax=Geothrix sp. PMB-07 TaxID=3068640 RepID=UPI0027409AF9|nr:DNA mismatch repair endonuclease MutL [Geothrix sp. PMB-07]WLT31559.1 DNA mismatch repair endonuclease MutL [Geothrix sp. PMB-07]
MSRIRILSDQVANQIAAGEVVERPSSVLKELVENALDADARHIEVAWEEGGKRLLEVADDGSGMARDDLYLALERHATSKVRTAEDLGHLGTFGFRGEALPSIASVSRFDLTSAESEGAGHCLRSEFGVIKGVAPATRSRGTTVSVRDLFAQLPARRRFLKSTDTEHAQLWGVVARLALSSPGVHWTIRPDRGSPLVLPPVEDAGHRLAPLLGEKLGRLVPFVNGERPWQLQGFVSPPDLSFRDRNHLYLFVNGRAVRDRLLLAALSEAWSGTFAKGSYPAAVLFLELPPEAVDVNVHPTKAEVRFREPQRVFAWVRGAAEEAWAKLRGGLASVLELPPKPLDAEFELDPSRRMEPQHPRLWSDHSGGGLGAYQALASAFPASPVDRAYTYEPTPSRVAESTRQETDIRYLGAFQQTYLLAEIHGSQGPELWIVDQHVAHERVLFERLFLRRHAPAIQPLLPPQVVQVGPEALARLGPFLAELAAAGVDAEPFGSDALVVRGLPDFLVDRDPQALLEDLLERLEREGRIDLDAFRRDLNAELACRAAIKKHHGLPPELALGLIRDLLACEVPNTCPHGRPIIKKLTLEDLDRSFGRRL